MNGFRLAPPSGHTHWNRCTLSNTLSLSIRVFICRRWESAKERGKWERGHARERECVSVFGCVCVAHRVERRKLCLNFFSLFNPCLISPFSFSVSLSLFFQSLSRLTQVYACCAYLWQSSTSVIWFVVPPSSTAIYSNSNVPTSFKPFWLKISNKKVSAVDVIFSLFCFDGQDC